MSNYRKLTDEEIEAKYDDEPVAHHALVHSIEDHEELLPEITPPATPKTVPEATSIEYADLQTEIDSTREQLQHLYEVRNKLSTNDEKFSEYTKGMNALLSKLSRGVDTKLESLEHDEKILNAIEEKIKESYELNEHIQERQKLDKLEKEIKAFNELADKTIAYLDAKTSAVKTNAEIERAKSQLAQGIKYRNQEMQKLNDLRKEKDEIKAKQLKNLKDNKDIINELKELSEKKTRLKNQIKEAQKVSEETKKIFYKHGIGKKVAATEDEQGKVNILSVSIDESKNKFGFFNAVSQISLLTSLQHEKNKEALDKYCQEHNYDLNKPSAFEMQFVSKSTNKPEITVTHQTVKADVTADTDREQLIKRMADLYLLAIEGKNITAHKVTHNDKDVEEMISKHLAKALIEKGLDGRINGKALSEVVKDDGLKIEPDVEENQSLRMKR